MAIEPKRCPTEELIIGLIDGVLTDVDRERVELHIDDCPDCRATVSAMARLQAPTPSGPPAIATGDVAPTWSPGTKVGRFIVTDILGRGGMGVVYAADDPELGRSVALKALRADMDADLPELEQRLRREAAMMASVTDPAVVTLFDVGIHQGCLFLAMERVNGDTLADWLAREPPWRDVVDCFIKAGRGLAAAHAAGVVHRDFKPENVLLDEQSRPHVADFGVARTLANQPSGSGRSSEGEIVSLTRTGALLGTPIYMAPEQLSGDPATAASDQFSFFVALYRGLYRSLPFGGDSIDELRAAHEHGVTLPERGDIPRRVGAVIARGLSKEPGERHPSMEAAIAALERAVAPRWRKRAMAAALLVLPLAAGLLAWSLVDSSPSPCGSAGDQAAEVWPGWRRIVVTRAFDNTGVSYAADSARRTINELDRYSGEWISMHGESCRATRVDGHQTEDQLALRTRCLDRRLRSLDALIDRFLAADARIAARAVEATSQLATIESCGDLEALSAPISPPADPVERARVEALDARLSEVESFYVSGSYRRGFELAESLVPDVEAAGYRPLEAEVLYARARFRNELGDHKAERDDLERAVLAAVAGRHDDVAARAAIELMVTVGHRLSDLAAVDALERQAAAAVERAGSNPEHQALLLRGRAITAWGRGKTEEARAMFQALLDTAEARHGTSASELLPALRGLSAVATRRMDGAKLVEINLRILAIQKAKLGDEHPDIAESVRQIGYGQYVSGRYEDALRSYEDALARRQRYLGDEHQNIAGILNTMATLYTFVGRPGEAVDTSRRAVAILVGALGDKHGRTLAAKIGLTQLLEVEERYAEANKILVDVIDILVAQHPDGHPVLVSALTSRGLVELGMRKPQEALATLLDAQTMERRLDSSGEGDPDLSRLVGQAYLELGRSSDAVGPLQHARDLLARTASGGDDVRVRRASSQLARALFDSGRDRAGGRKLAIETERRIRDDERLGHMHKALASWMKERRIPISVSKTLDTAERRGDR